MANRVLLLLVIVSFVLGCSTKRKAIGEPDQLIVIADSVDWQRAELLIEEVFASEFPMPRPEPWYQVEHVAPVQFSQYMNYRNVIIFSLLREGSPSLKLIEQVFSKSLVSAMKSGEQPVATKRNPWRKDQFIMVLTTPSFAQMKSLLEQRGDELRGYLDEVVRERQMDYLYGRYEQEKMQRRLQEDYNWTFRVPRDWVIIHERPDSNFFWIGRNLPIRWLSAHWQDTSSTVVVDSALAVQLRIKAGQQLYGDIQTNLDYLSAEHITIDNRPAVRIRGIWAHEFEAKGGPFTGVAYYDPDTQRLFYLDGQVFAPDLQKLLYLRQEEMILSTFTSGEPPERLR